MLKKIKYYLISIGLFFGILFLLLLIASAIFAYTSVKDNLIEPVIYFSIGISSFISSFALCRKIKNNGIINGIVINLISLLIIFVISSVINQKIVFTNTLGIYCFVVSITGILGGILGVNV